MRFRDYLIEHGACKAALDWLGNHGLKWAVLNCPHAGWADWFLYKSGLMEQNLQYGLLTAVCTKFGVEYYDVFQNPDVLMIRSPHYCRCHRAMARYYLAEAGFPKKLIIKNLRRAADAH